MVFVPIAAARHQRAGRVEISQPKRPCTPRRSSFEGGRRVKAQEVPEKVEYFCSRGAAGSLGLLLLGGERSQGGICAVKVEEAVMALRWHPWQRIGGGG
jgi:hypothetical protein